MHIYDRILRIAFLEQNCQYYKYVTISKVIDFAITLNCGCHMNLNMILSLFPPHLKFSLAYQNNKDIRVKLPERAGQSTPRVKPASLPLRSGVLYWEGEATRGRPATEQRKGWGVAAIERRRRKDEGGHGGAPLPGDAVSSTLFMRPKRRRQMG